MNLLLILAASASVGHAIQMVDTSFASVPAIIRSLDEDPRVSSYLDVALSDLRQNEVIFSLLPAPRSKRSVNLTVLPDPAITGKNEFVSETFEIVLAAHDCERPWASDVLGLIPNVFLHEYGHAIFQSNLNGLYGRIAAAVRKAASSENDAAVSLLRRGDSEAAKAAFDAVPVTIEEMTSPFNELFGDIVSVLILKNHKAMADALRVCHPKFTISELRDFSFDYGPTTQSRKPIVTDPHQVLNLARRHIWKTLETTLKDNDKAREIIIKATWQASADVMLCLNPDGTLRSSRWYAMSATDLNAMFITKFDAVIKSMT